VLDLAGVGFMDSTGLRELRRALERAREQSLELVIACALDSPVRRLLGLTNLDAEFRLVEDVHDAAPTGG
ncbi:MAG: STAS domain-containing protein, partial [Acidimicrobiia bacterium]